MSNITPEIEQEYADMCIWAMGGKGSKDIVHAYINDSALSDWNCLCGRGVKPYIQIERVDLSDENMVKNICPQCRSRLQLLRYMKK